MNEISLKKTSSPSSSSPSVGLERNLNGSNHKQDKELDALIFGGGHNPYAPSNEVDNLQLSQPPHPSRDNSDEHEVNNNTPSNDMEDRNSYPNVIPLDKLKNGATTASKMFSFGWKKMKDKSSAGWEQATEQWGKVKETDTFKRTSNAAHVGWEKTVTTVDRMKETEAVKKATSVAAASWEKTKAGASQAKESMAPALEKAKQTASVGLEKAKAGAASGIEVIKTKTGIAQDGNSKS